MKHLVDLLGNGETRLKFKYLKLFRKLYIKDGVLYADFINNKQFNHLIKLLKYFGSELKNQQVHPSNETISSYKVSKESELIIFLSKYIDLSEPTWNAKKRILNYDKLYKHVQPSKIK